MSEDRPRYGAGWVSDLPTSHGAAPRVVQLRLGAFVRDAGEAQQRAWEHWIPSQSAIGPRWGSDLLRVDGAWSIARSRGTRGRLHDPLAIRRNVYRVLLTRGRDGTAVWLPSDEGFATTRAFLREAGFRGLRESGAELP